MIPIIFYTEQGFDLRTFTGCLLPIHGTYADNIEISSAQAQLYEMLETDQVVWCSPNKLPTVPLEAPKFIHRIKVTQDDIASVVDGFIWEHIIGHSRFVPSADLLDMRQSCMCLDDASRQAELRRLESAYLAEHLPNDLWASVVKKDGNCSLPQYLLHWPFRTASVLDVEII